MNDRYKLHQFYQGKESEVKYLRAGRLKHYDIDAENLWIDYTNKWSNSDFENELFSNWTKSLKNLNKVQRLKINLENQDILDAVCEMKNLKELIIPFTKDLNFFGLRKIKPLARLEFYGTSYLSDISFLKTLNLKQLLIHECFKIKNYEIIGDIKSLTGLSLSGNWTAPKNLRLKSIVPFEQLKNLEHLDLSFCSIMDKSYDSVLKMEKLERFDILTRIPKKTRNLIKSNHQSLKAGFFMDWDYEKKEFYKEKNWSQ